MLRGEPRYRRVKSIFVLLQILPSLPFLFWGWQGRNLALPFSFYRMDASLLLLIGVGIIFLASVAAVSSVRWSAASFFSLYTALAVLAVGQIGSRQQAHKVISAVAPTRVVRSQTEWVGDLYGAHERYGSQHLPSTTVQHHTVDFDVTYSTDEEGWRRMPIPARPLTSRPIAFVGCSVTFGQGVYDDQTFPWLLASQAWPGYRVLNYSRSGWGTNHALVVVDELLQRKEKPLCIIYGWLTIHHRRNDRRRSWFEPNLQSVFPYFALEEGKLVRQGFLRGIDATAPDTKEQTAREFEISSLMIEAMHRQCQEHGVPFVVLRLADRQMDPVWTALQKQSEIPTIDVSWCSDEVYPNDHHPTFQGHRYIAKTIAADPTVARVTGIDELFQPGAIEASPPDFRRLFLAVLPEGNSYAVSKPVPDRPAGLRVEPHLTKLNPYGAKVTRRWLPLIKGETYLLRFEARADEPRPLIASVLQAREPWLELGCSEVVELGPEWKTYEVEFVALQDESDAAIVLALGMSPVPVEIGDVLLLRDSQAVEPRPPRTPFDVNAPISVSSTP